MATSAFRSTTKRSQVGPAGDAVPATPLKGRSSVFSDANSKYFSDSSSMSDARYGEGKSRASSRRFSVDSETDADGQSKRHQRSRRRDGSESDGSSYRSLRRSASQSDKHRSRRENMFSDREASGDEMQVEERTIRAVHAQMKQIRNNNPTEELDVIGLYDAMRAEVRQAIADLKKEIRQSVSGTHFDTVDVRKRYAERLEESEQRASQLWSELAAEEERCAELSNIMKDLLPDDRGRVVKRAFRSRRYGSQRQTVSQSLDEDARKYFDECVSVSKLECEPDMSERSSVVSTEFTEPESIKLSSSEPAPTPASSTKQVKNAVDRDRACQPANTARDQQRGAKLIVARPGSTEEQNSATSSAPLKQKHSITGLSGSSASSKTRSSKVSQSQCGEDQDEPKSRRTRRTPVNVDGIAMPWLEWETGSSETSRRSRRQNKFPDSTSSTDSDIVNRSHSKQRYGSSNNISSLSAQLTSSSSSSITSNKSSSSDCLSEIEFLPHRFRYVNRIVSGRMHLCMEAL